jgi:alkyldihydroxyacetonephosphate synthase
MPDVKHMKWWGWGVEGVRFHHEDKPAFRPFLINAIDLDQHPSGCTDVAR